MPLFVWIALGLFGALALAKGGKNPKDVTEKDVGATVARALAQETDTAVLRKFQYALSAAGFFAEATAIMNRANALDAAVAIEVQTRTAQTIQYGGQGGLITALPH